MPDELDLLAGLDIEPRSDSGRTAGADRASDARDHGGDRERGSGSDRGADTPSKREILASDRGEKIDKPDAKPKRTEKTHRQSVADSIRAAVREHSGDEGLPEKPTAGRERGPDGKFVKAEQTESARPQSKPQSQEDAPAAAPTTGDSGAPSAAPNGWTDAAKAEWAKLPPAVREAVTKRETDMTEGARQLQARYGPIYQLTNDQTIVGAAQKYGVSREQLLQNGFSWMIAVERNPAAGILGLCQAYKIDPKTLTAASAAQPGVQGTTTQPQDPRVAQLEQRLNAFEQTRQTEANATQQAAIASWSKDKKHFERVRPTMVQVIQIAAMQNDMSILDAQGNVDLNKVYARAVRLHDDVFNDVLRESRSKRQSDQTAEAQKARRTAASVQSGSPAGTQGDGEEKPLPKGSSVRAHIQQAMARVRA